MTTDRTLRLATRGSDLALRQAATVEEALASRRQSVELVEVETTGDQLQDELIHRLGKTGAFVRSLDQQVLDGGVDAAVHSMKDVPTESPPELVVAGVPDRGPAGDVLLTPDGATLSDLPEGATVGTASLRRGAELRSERPDLEIEPLRGNVDTRVEKLLAPTLQREHERRLEEAASDQEDEDGAASEDIDPDDLSDDAIAEIEEWFDGLHEIERRATERDVEIEYDAIVLAEAGLARTGLLHAVEFERLPTDRFVPAPGQGALAVTALDDEVGTEIHDRLDHPPTRVTTSVERIVLDELGGGCVAPIGGRDGTEEVAASRDLPVERHARAASELAADLREQGAAELIQRAKREEPDERKREDS